MSRRQIKSSAKSHLRQTSKSNEGAATADDAMVSSPADGALAETNATESGAFSPEKFDLSPIPNSSESFAPSSETLSRSSSPTTGVREFESDPSPVPVIRDGDRGEEGAESHSVWSANNSTAAETTDNSADSASQADAQNCPESALVPTAQADEAKEVAMSLGDRLGLSGDYEVVYELEQPPIQSFAAASLAALMQGPKPGLTASDFFESLPRDDEMVEEMTATDGEEPSGRRTRADEILISPDYGSSGVAGAQHKVVAVETVAASAVAASGGFFAQLWGLLRGFGGRSRSAEQEDEAQKSGPLHAGR